MKYDAIIDLPRPKSSHPRMASPGRAAQFSPFAALTGHGDAVRETERLADIYSEPDDNMKELINAQLQIIGDQPDAVVSITYFKKDTRKDGGTYLTVSGTVKKIDNYTHTVKFQNGTAVPINDIRSISGDMFRFLDV